MDERKAGPEADGNDAADIEHLSKAVVRLSNELANVRRELEEAKAQLRNREEQVRVMSLVDGITGLGNPKAFEQALEVEVHRAGRYGGPLCLALAAIDGLEGIASHLGQEQADEVLRCFARVVGNETRKSDLACRVGDNRFMLLLTHTPPDRAAGVTERIRRSFAEALYRRLRTIALTATDLPEPVVPPISRCGMRARSAMTGSPPISLPSASGRPRRLSS